MEVFRISTTNRNPNMHSQGTAPLLAKKRVAERGYDLWIVLLCVPDIPGGFLASRARHDPSVSTNVLLKFVVLVALCPCHLR